VNPAVAPPYNTTTTTTTTQPATVAAVGTTTTDANGATTTITPNGSITRSSSTTVVLPDGTVKTVNGDNATAVAGAPGTVTTRTVTTITTKTTTPPATTVVQTVPANMGYYPPPPMTSSETTIYQPPLRPVLYHGRRYPGFDFLAFATRASFSTNNRSLDGTVNTGALGTDIRNENGWGFGFNKYFGHNWSTEFTASRIQPRATLTPTNASVNPITGVRLKMTPITGTLQLHFNPRSSVDLNIGGGAAYVMFKADDSFNPGTSGLTSVKFRDEFGPLVNAGLAFNMSHNFGLRFDAKYMWIRARATTTFNDGVAVIGNVGNTEHIGLNPFVLSAGLRFGF
jgi:outer membrane protein W